MSVRFTACRVLSLTIVWALAAGGCSSMAVRHASTAPVKIDFAGDAIGAMPAGFSPALTGGGGPTSWVIREDNTAPANARVLVQESADGTKYRFPLCIYDKVIVRDVAVEVSFKAISGKIDQAGGIVLRYSPENYYIARANALEDNVILFKTVGGKRSKIEEVPSKVTRGEWHTLRFEANGRRLKVAFDGKTVIDRDDDTFTASGKVGLWTKADSVSAFANLKVERVP